MITTLIMQTPAERRPTTIFFFLSLAIFIAITLFVAINVYSNDRNLERSLHTQSEELRANFDMALSLTYRNMMQLAMYISSDPEITSLFLQGKKAVEAEGGGKGGPEADMYRKQLYRKLAPSWKELSQQYDVRQLHFHLAPGSLSYLRVHRPEKFGDRMDNLRYTIVDTNAELAPRTGFETGRVYSGIRAIVPVFATDPLTSESTHTGALEVGTAFSNIMHLFSGTGASLTAVLLHREHIENAMWPEAIERRFPSSSRLNGSYIEALSSPELASLLSHPTVSSNTTGLRTSIAHHKGNYYAITQFPLIDYRNSLQGNESAGTIVLARNINEPIRINTTAMHYNLLYALVAFITIELLLFFGLKHATRRLRAVIDKKVKHIEELNEYLAEQAVTDGLTGLHNHRFFIERLGEEINKSQRSGNPLSILMLDIDHFKQVNDSYGHQAGDSVLETLAHTIKGHVRLGDEAGRYGGEEFSIVLTCSTIEEAHLLAQRLHSAIRALEIKIPNGKVLHITASMGIAQWDGTESIQLLIERADQALYQAKTNGRDRIEIAKAIE